MTNLNPIFLKGMSEAAIFKPEWLHEPYSWVGHIPFASWLVRIVKPEVIVELGTHSGNSYFSICQAVKQYETGSKCYAVDTWHGDAHALSYGEEIYRMVQKHNEEHYASFSTLLRMTFDDALSKFKNRSVNLLHIDGLHTYEAVRHDFETWLPKLAPGAIILFHDTNVRKEDFGVWKYWAELCRRYKYNCEFTHSYGLGVLGVFDSTDEDSGALFSHPDLEYFFSLGNIYETNALVGGIGSLNNQTPWQLQALFMEREELRGKILSMQGSLSWRLTSPLRFADKIKRNLFQPR